MSDLKRRFFEALERNKFCSRSKWDDIALFEQSQGDAEFSGLFNTFNSNGERKQAFSEFLNHIAKKEKDFERQSKQNARKFFKEAFTSFVTNDNFEILTFPKIAAQFHAIPQWNFLPEEEIDDIYQDVMDEFESKGIEHDIKQSRIDKLKNLFKDDPRINHQLRFSEVCRLYNKATEFDVYNITGLMAWREFVDESLKQEKLRNRHAKQRKERKARDAFRKLLISMEEKWKGCAWKEFHKLIETREAYIDLIGTSGSQPYDLFASMFASRDDEISSSIEIID